MNNTLQRPWHSFYPAGLSPRAEYPQRALWGFLSEGAKIHGDRKALINGARRWSYQQLWEDATRANTLLLSLLDFSAEIDRPRVMLWLPNMPEFVIYYYGALHAGAIVSTASIALTTPELAAQIKDAAPQIVVVQGKRHDALADAIRLAGVEGVRLVVIEEQSLDGLVPEPAAAHAAFDPAREIAVLQYTSGTTGAAKGAMMSHRNLVANALQNARWFGWSGDEITLAALPLYHTWGMCCCMNSTFATGGALVLHDNEQPFDAEKIYAAIAHHGATVMYGSATMFHRMLDVNPANDRLLASLRHVKAGAMLTQGDLKARWDGRFPHAPLQQGYGLTEASPESHNNPPENFRRGTVGVPLQDTDCCIVDADNPSRLLVVGEAGEVLLRGPQIMLGYWRKPDASAAAFHDGWLKTGDIGVMDQDGYLTIVDRKKDLIKFRGYSVSANNVEECLLRNPCVKEVVVVGRRDERDGEIPVACVVLHVGFGADAEQSLRLHCEQALAAYERPREYRFIDVIPRNHVGKPLRRELRDEINR